MDELELRVVDEPFPNGEHYPSVQIFINGRDFMDLVVEAEQAMGAFGQNPPIGAYRGIWPEAMFLPSRRLLGEAVEDAEPFDEDGLVSLYGCECGFVDCWPLRVEIVVGAQTVRWQGFRHPWMRGLEVEPPWEHFELGPFEFDRRRYEAELSKDWKRDKYPLMSRQALSA
jgi:hypothetical protein